MSHNYKSRSTRLAKFAVQNTVMNADANLAADINARINRIHHVKAGADATLTPDDSKLLVFAMAALPILGTGAIVLGGGLTLSMLAGCGLGTVAPCSGPTCTTQAPTPPTTPSTCPTVLHKYFSTSNQLNTQAASNELYAAGCIPSTGVISNFQTDLGPEHGIFAAPGDTSQPGTQAVCYADIFTDVTASPYVDGTPLDSGMKSAGCFVATKYVASDPTGNSDVIAMNQNADDQTYDKQQTYPKNTLAAGKNAVVEPISSTLKWTQDISDKLGIPNTSSTASNPEGRTWLKLTDDQLNYRAASFYVSQGDGQHASIAMNTISTVAGLTTGKFDTAAIVLSWADAQLTSAYQPGHSYWTFQPGTEKTGVNPIQLGVPSPISGTAPFYYISVDNNGIETVTTFTPDVSQLPAGQKMSRYPVGGGTQQTVSLSQDPMGILINAVAKAFGQSVGGSVVAKMDMKSIPGFSTKPRYDFALAV